MAENEWTRCPAADCDLPAVVAMRMPMHTFGKPAAVLLRIECFAGHSRVVPEGSVETFEVLE